MKLVIKNSDEQFIETFTINEFKSNKFKIHEDLLGKLSFFREILTANMIISNESIESKELSNLKLYLKKLNIELSRIYTSSREALITAKSLKIDCTFLKEEVLRKESFLIGSKKLNYIFHKRTIRSGERISSNGDLFIVGDVNPGAIVSAKENVYIWGRLLGIAFAGESGNKNASISALFLNPLQLRIAGIIAIGPQEKPKNHYPEIALINKDKIIIRPFITKS